MRLVLQRANGDCGIAALATLLDAAYEDIYLAAAAVDSRHGKSGLRQRDMVAIAKILGVRLKRKRSAINLACDEGILDVKWIKKRTYAGHYVVLGNGVIVDPSDGRIADPEDYLLEESCALGSLLEVR
jgi:ABC-type bacteriocin/lantibiotic exporter with double-glycine peptidase domain